MDTPSVPPLRASSAKPVDVPFPRQASFSDFSLGAASWHSHHESDKHAPAAFSLSHVSRSLPSDDSSFGAASRVITQPLLARRHQAPSRPPFLSIAPPGHLTLRSAGWSGLPGVLDEESSPSSPRDSPISCSPGSGSPGSLDAVPTSPRQRSDAQDEYALMSRQRQETMRRIAAAPYP